MEFSSFLITGLLEVVGIPAACMQSTCHAPSHARSFTEVGNTRLCGSPATYLGYTALNLLCPAGLFPTACVQLLKELSLPIESGGTAKTTMTGWGSSIRKMWEQGLAAWILWADLNELWIWRLTLPLKHSAGPTAYGDNEQ